MMISERRSMRHGVGIGMVVVGVVQDQNYL
jgi:hypothetical protein